MKKIKIALIVLISWFINLVFLKNIFAQCIQTSSTVCLTNPLNATSTIGILNNIIIALQVYIAPPIAAIMVLIGAFQILFAAGDPEKFKTGKKTILYAFIGYAIVLIAGGITSIITDILK
ncbi:MAG: hypothetical protein QMD50_02430 [Patescibacteria group bacterium]|nr:hypothetical protein [Patescibacteria group bacterium]